MQPLIALICFFLSGFAGLVYEVVWIRQASLLFGSATFALSTVLAVFFLGLACGSYLFGRYGQRTGHPLLVFALVEIGLGLSALASPYAFELADILYGAVYQSLAGYAILHFLTRIVLVGFAVLPSTVLMGATLLSSVVSLCAVMLKLSVPSACSMASTPWAQLWVVCVPDLSFCLS